MSSDNNKDASSSSIADKLAKEAAELDGYFSDTSLQPQPNYPALQQTFETSIIITNLPKVEEKKLEKLTKVVYKLVSRIGTLVSTGDNDEGDEDDNNNEDETGGSFNGVMMPYDKEKGTTLGFCMVEYETQEQAKNAVEVLQGYKFDKNHSLSVTLYERAKKLQNLASSTDFSTPKIEPFKEKPNAMQWYEDPNQRDSFVIRYGKETVVNWSDAKNDPVVDYDGSREKDAGLQWCEYYCSWSPNGSYLATLVPARGVILWSGENYEKTGRFVAPGVTRVLFSPQENYLITFNDNNVQDNNAVKVYHLQTGNLLRAFPLYPDHLNPATKTNKTQQRDNNDNDQQGGGGPPPPPPFLWSHDDKYLARIGDGLISIYETPGMKLLDKRSLAADGVKEFHWSPKANVIAYWAPGAQNSPAHVDLIEIPSRKKLRQKNLFNVTTCAMVWQDQGDYLAVKVTRHTKSKKTLYNNIELFRLNETGVPVEMLDTKDAVMALSWEPKGSRFAMVHAENPGAAKVNVSFYDMMKQGHDVSVKGAKKGQPKSQDVTVAELNKIETLEGKQCNCLFWSPAGSTIIMASLGESASGTLEFYDVDSKTLVAVKEHYRANQVLWDPSGRTVTTIVSQPIDGGHFKFAMDNGFIMWSFQGKQLYQQSYETFYQFLWRPRESLLSKKEIEKVKKNLRKYEKRFDKADRKRQRALYLEETKGKRAERSAYRELLAHNREIRAKQRPERVALLDGYDSEDKSNFIVRDLVIERVLTSKEEVVL